MEQTGAVTCRAKGFPVPGIYWYFQTGEGKLGLSFEDTYKNKFSISRPRRNDQEEWIESILTIKSVQVQDWKSNYTCVASNSEGSTDRVVHLKGFGIQHLFVFQFK